MDLLTKVAHNACLNHILDGEQLFLGQLKGQEWRWPTYEDQTPGRPQLSLEAVGIGWVILGHDIYCWQAL